MDDEVEEVAQVFYLTGDCVRGWTREPEIIKESFRDRARLALDPLGALRRKVLERVALLTPRGQAGDRDAMAERDLQQDLPGFVAVLSGATHVYHFVNKAHRRLTGYRALIGRAARDAVPELKEQGNLQILDEVYETGLRYVATRVPLRIRMHRNGPLENRLINVSYRPIVGERGERLGVVVEGRDVTERD